MKKILPLLAILVVAVLLLSACGEPAYPADASHGDDDAHAEAAEGEHAATESEETEAQDMDNAEHDEAEETAPDADEAAENHDADMDTTEEPAEDAAEEPVAEEDSEQDSAENAEVTEAEEAEEVEEPAEAEATTSVGDPANGEALFNQMITEVSFACATCHRVDSDLQLIGPGLLGVAERTGERDPEATPEEYVHTSIINPDDYVVEGFSADLMPEVYTEIFTEQEIADLVSYVLSLEG